MKTMLSMLCMASLGTAAFLAAPSAHAQTSACNFNAHAAAVAGVGPTGNIVVLAHRGVWGLVKGAHNDPENSRGAIETARDSCLDGMELDVKLTKDQVPVLMHDTNLGRTTNVYTRNSPAAQKYDPYKNTGDNPTVSFLTAAQVTALQLLDNRNRDLTGYHVPTVESALDYWSISPKGTVVFDVKDVLTMQKVIAAARASLGTRLDPLGAGLFYKLNATIFPTYAAYLSAAGANAHITPIPVYTPNMLVKINVPASYADWAKHVHHIEIDMKTTNGLLSDIYNSAERNPGIKVGVFNAIPDADRSTGEFFKSNGQCCYKLNDLLVVSSTLRDSTDQRGSFGYVTDNFDIITTDDPFGLLDTL